MFPAAQIAFNADAFPVDLDSLSRIVSENCSIRVSRTEWKGYATVIPQILVHTTVPFTIQIDDDPEYVPDEIDEWPDEDDVHLTQEEIAHLKLCRCRLDVMTTVAPPVIENDKSIAVIATGNDVDPREDETHKVLSTIAKELNGFIHDCVNGGVIPPPKQNKRMESNG